VDRIIAHFKASRPATRRTFSATDSRFRIDLLVGLLCTLIQTMIDADQRQIALKNKEISELEKEIAGLS
jgi:hypothetical protein